MQSVTSVPVTYVRVRQLQSVLSLGEGEVDAVTPVTCVSVCEGKTGAVSDRCTSNLCEGEVDTVSQRGDDQTAVQTHVLVAVAEAACALPDLQLVRFPYPVKPQLALPLKLLGVHDAVERLATLRLGDIGKDSAIFHARIQHTPRRQRNRG